MNFGDAIQSLKDGYKVARAGWNDKGMFLIYVKGHQVVPKLGTPYSIASIMDEGGKVTINPHIDMHTATGEMQPGWSTSQTDMLATDWEVVN